MGRVGFEFTTEIGAPLHPAFVTGQFEQPACQAGLPPACASGQAPISPFGAAAITIMVVRQGVPNGGSASRNPAYCFDGLLAGSAGWCWPSVRRVARERAIQRS